MKRLVAAIGLLTLILTGCFNQSSQTLSVNGISETEAVTKVSFQIENGSFGLANLRAQTTSTPEVWLELKLINPGSISSPYSLLKKKATVTETSGKYAATVQFTEVPAKPSLARLSVVGGYLVDSSSGNQVSTWTGALDLVGGISNTISLYPEGGKSLSDVTVNVVEELIKTTANVATFPYDLITRVNSSVATVNLNSVTVYSDALNAFVATNGLSSQPSDAEFDAPAGYTSVAFPKSGSSVSLTIPDFKSGSIVYLAFINRTSSSLAPSWSASLGSPASIRANLKANTSFADNSPLNNSQKLHKMIRDLEKRLPRLVQNEPSSLKGSLRADAIGTAKSFYYFDANNTNLTLTAKCVKVVSIAGTNKLVNFYLDTDLNESDSNAQTILNGLADRWASIYTTNRNIFGAEPEGIVNSIDATNFTILISKKIGSAGYFYTGDLYTEATAVYSGFHSNERKMFYLQYPASISDVNKDIEDMASTMAHEFQHMIYFKQKTGLNTADWLNEAMAGYAEYVNYFRIENQKNQSKALQVNRFFANLGSTNLTNWQGSHENYGEVYLFGVWLGQNYGSSGVVQNLLSSSLTGTAAVAAFTGGTFDAAFSKFMLALQLNNSNGGVYGIQGLDLTGTYSFGTGWAPVTLTGVKTSNYSTWLGSNSGTIVVGGYSAGYVKLSGGNGGTLTINANLPTGVSLYQLKYY